MHLSCSAALSQSPRPVSNLAATPDALYENCICPTHLAGKTRRASWVELKSGIATTGTTLPCQGTRKSPNYQNPLPFCVLCASADRLLNP